MKLQLRKIQHEIINYRWGMGCFSFQLAFSVTAQTFLVHIKVRIIYCSILLSILVFGVYVCSAVSHTNVIILKRILLNRALWYAKTKV